MAGKSSSVQHFQPENRYAGNEPEHFRWYFPCLCVREVRTKEI